MSFQAPSSLQPADTDERARLDESLTDGDVVTSDTDFVRVYPRQVVCEAAPGGTCRIIRKHHLMAMLGIRRSATRRLQEASQGLADELGEPLSVGMRYSALVIFEPHKPPKRIVLEQIGNQSPACDLGWDRFARNLSLTKPGIPFHAAVRDAFRAA